MEIVAEIDNNVKLPSIWMIQVEDFRERAYPWGSVDIENQVQKDFIRKPHKKVPIVYPITKTLLLELMGHQNFFI